MSYTARTDIALEARDLYIETSNIEGEIEGVEVDVSNPIENTTVSRVKIVSEKGASALNKPEGNYITIDIPPEIYGEQKVYEEVCKVVAKELMGLIPEREDETVLVVGLGNRNVTPDALGPAVIDSLLVTRHLIRYIPKEIDERLRPLCAIAPGVLGITGIETGEIVKGICEKVKPSLLIVIDALCSRSMRRINTTIQISDTGITPGAGIGNNRMAINKETLGIPVIAIGVPTVVDAATITGDSIDFLIGDLKENAKENEPLYKMLTTISAEDKYALIKQTLSDNIGDFIVTPKEIDKVIEDISSVIANGINISVHKGIELSDIDRYI